MHKVVEAVQTTKLLAFETRKKTNICRWVNKQSITGGMDWLYNRKKSMSH